MIMKVLRRYKGTFSLLNFGWTKCLVISEFCLDMQQNGCKMASDQLLFHLWFYTGLLLLIGPFSLATLYLLQVPQILRFFF